MKRVALFTRAWIEIALEIAERFKRGVALFTRAWIEITVDIKKAITKAVALFTRAWIEIPGNESRNRHQQSRPLHEGVD